MAPHHPNSFFGWVDLLTATPGLALLHGNTPMRILKAGMGTRGSAVRQLIGGQFTTTHIWWIPLSKAELKKNQQVSSLISLFIEDHIVNLKQFFYFTNMPFLLSGLSLVTTDLDGDTYIH